MSKKLTVLIDGGMLNGNPGPGGWGAVFKTNTHTWCRGGTYGQEKITSNVAEYRALINALMLLKTDFANYKHVSIKSDSLLVVKQVRNEWAAKHVLMRRYAELAQALMLELELNGTNVTLEHTPRKNTMEAHRHIASILGRVS